MAESGSCSAFKPHCELLCCSNNYVLEKTISEIHSLAAIMHIDNNIADNNLQATGDGNNTLNAANDNYCPLLKRAA
jgi:hypothetical protein